MNAPVCPISNGQIQYYQALFRGNGGVGLPPTTNSIPNATDLPSLIRTVNVMRDMLRQMTSSLTVNNLYLPKPPSFKAEGDKYYSHYPSWDQKEVGFSFGFVTGKKDKSSRAYVRRINRVVFENREQDDKPFVWSYTKEIK